MTGTQMRLPGIDPPRQIRPVAERLAPVFWVRRLRVLRQLATGNEHIVRDVELRRGFNIIWAPPLAAGNDNALFRDGVTSHTAGKSTFCRLLRHILGDGGFAPDRDRPRIRSVLPTGWIVGEVIVGETAWVVARPLSIGPHPFCVRGGDVESIADATERLDYAEFLEAIGQTTWTQLSATRFPATDEEMRWEHVLPWLVRDQDCRFSDFLEWRHVSSGSETASLNVDERQFVVRAVLGLISSAETAEQQQNARLVSERREAARWEPLLRHQAETDRGRLSRALGRELPLASTPLFGSETRAELVRLRGDLEGREETLKDGDRRDELQSALDETNKAEGAIGESIKEMKARLAIVQGSVSELAGEQQSGLLATLPPPYGFCNVPLRLAREKGCPIAFDRPADLTAKRSERSAAQDLAAERLVATELESEVGRLEAALQGARDRTTDARRTLFKAQTDYEQLRANLQRERSGLDTLDRLVEAAEEAAQEAIAKSDSITQLTRDIDHSYKLQDEIREEQRAALSRFSARFDYVVRALIGENIEARVDASGRSLGLVVEEHGIRESAAIATIKLLAFDLAAMVTSIEGEGAFPRFLVHDGPREADMALDVYERLFLFARELEKCFAGEPAFQYIVTTTTQPPDAFIEPGTPWLRLQLAGHPAGERLLRSDL